MTDQEKREKEIEEMASYNCRIKDCKNCVMGDRRCISYHIASELYDAGYRKEEEVQKETLKNLFSSVSSFVNFSVQFLGLDLPVIRLNDLKDIIKNEFGVEVDE